LVPAAHELLIVLVLLEIVIMHGIPSLQSLLVVCVLRQWRAVGLRGKELVALQHQLILLLTSHLAHVTSKMTATCVSIAHLTIANVSVPEVSASKEIAPIALTIQGAV